MHSAEFVEAPGVDSWVPVVRVEAGGESQVTWSWRERRVNTPLRSHARHSPKPPVPAPLLHLLRLSSAGRLRHVLVCNWSRQHLGSVNIVACTLPLCWSSYKARVGTGLVNQRRLTWVEENSLEDLVILESNVSETYFYYLTVWRTVSLSHVHHAPLSTFPLYVLKDGKEFNLFLLVTPVVTVT